MRLPGACSCLLALRLRCLLLLCLVLFCHPAMPQDAELFPWRRAPIIEPRSGFETPPPPVRATPPTVAAVAQVFLDACVLNEGQPAAVVDWALTHGFEPLDPLRIDAQELLGGVQGTALAVPGSAGLVVLAVTQDGRCVVWAERMSGPNLRAAFQSMVSDLESKGARVQTVIARNLNSGGAWRHQAQWRYRRVGGSQDFGLGSATTLADAPGAQLLHFAPMEPIAPPDPDGMPRR